MEIVLPATFEGGMLRIRSGTQTVSEAFVDHHGSTTSVVSWFISSSLTGSQVTAGAAIVMSYYIRCPPGISKPVPPTDPESVLNAIDAIKAWTEGGVAKVRRPIAIPLRSENGQTSANPGLSEEERNKLKLAESMLDGMELRVGLAIFEHQECGKGIENREGVYRLRQGNTVTITILSVQTRTGEEIISDPVVVPDEDTPAALAAAWGDIATAPQMDEVRRATFIRDRDVES